MSFEEQKMSKDKFLSIFSPANEGYCVYYFSNIFLKTRDLKTGEYQTKVFPSSPGAYSVT